MFQGQCLCPEIRGQGQKNVIGGTVPSYFAKLFIILYSLVKMTSGCYTLESVPEKKIIEIRTVYPRDLTTPSATICHPATNLH
jgi:hypothetical protein